MDIRNYFRPLGSQRKSSTQPKKKDNSEDNHKEGRTSSSSSSFSSLRRKTKRILDSDSEDEEESSEGKKKQKTREKPKAKSQPKTEAPRLKPTSASSFFGEKPLVRKEVDNEVVEVHSDEVVEVHSDEVVEVHSDKVVEVQGDEVIEVQGEEDEGDVRPSKRPRKEEGDEEEGRPSQPSRLASKLSLKLKAFQFKKEEDKKGDKEREKMDRDKKNLDKDREKIGGEKNLDKDKDGKKIGGEKNLDKDRDGEKIGGEKSHDKDRNREKIGERNLDKYREKMDRDKSHDNDRVKMEGGENYDKDRKREKIGGEKNLDKDRNKVKMHRAEKKKEVKLEKEAGSKKEEKKDRHDEEGREAKKGEKNGDAIPEEGRATPSKAKPEGGDAATPQDEKKQHSREAYMKYLRRSGPANPGSKLIPEGAPNCLQGLVFVLSGVFDSLDREEASELVKKYGGRVTTSVSRNTSYLVLGSEAGQSKLKKAEQVGTKLLDEDGLLELIRSSPGRGDATPKGKASEKKVSERDAKADGARETPASHDTSPAWTPSPTRRPLQSCPASQESGSPSSAASSPRTQPVSSQDLAGRPCETLMWVDKYRPSSLKQIIGQQGDRSNVKKLRKWMEDWHKNQRGNKKIARPSPWSKDDNGAFFKAALLSGPPGVGKTTSAHLVCNELGFHFVELNASDARSKRTLDEVVSELLSSRSIAGFVSSDATSKHALIMDEVDGMSGNEDRGGVQELIALIKKSKVPVIAMCNDRNHPKIRSLVNHCFDLRFPKPRIEQIRGPMMSVCFREGIKIKQDALDQVIVGANQDVRQILHHLSMWSANQSTLNVDDVKNEAQRAKKDLKKGPWDVCRAVFSESEHKTMSIHDKSDLFFHDYSIGPLFVQENYPKVVPHIAKGKQRTTLEQLAKTASVLADGDLVERAIRSSNAWALLPMQAMFSSVLPGEYLCGHLSSQIEFPRWLGNNSRRNKFDRLMQELQTHTRIRTSGSKLDVGMDYVKPLLDAVTGPLAERGGEGVRDAVGVMNAYDLLREDVEGLQELSQWPGTKDPMSRVESKVKAAFTRSYNKESHLSPFAASSAPKKRRRDAGEDWGEDEDNEEEEEEEEDVAKASMIKVKKGNAKDREASKGKGTGASQGKGGRRLK